MVAVSSILLSAIAGVFALWFGYRGATAGRLYRSLSGIDTDSTTGLVDGETVALEGAVVVEESARASERVVEGADGAVGAYVWRAQFPQSGKNVVDWENRELRQKKATFASGVEAGSLAVTASGNTVRVDPGWLAETHESAQLSELTVGGVTKSDTFSTYLWDSPYVHLDGTVTECSLDRLAGVVEKHNHGVDLDRYTFESNAITEGTTLAVRGEVRVDQGEAVIRGTDETPLVLSDRGFDEPRRNLRNRAIKYGLFALVALAVIVLLLSL